ncbi:MAG: anthranilate synthase component I [Aquisalimonadaceae bacterium]
MNKDAFQALADQGHNRIPVIREVLADLDTPLSTYLKLADGPYSFLLESVQGGEKWGRYSIIGLPARTVVRVHENHITVTDGEVVTESLHSDDPLAWLEDFHARYDVPSPPGHPHLPRFIGGLAGYFGYDTIRYIEPRLAARKPVDDIGVPDILLMVADEVLVFDNLGGRLYLVVHADPTVEGAFDQAQLRLDALVSRLRAGGGVDKLPGHAARAVEEQDFTCNFTQGAFEAMVGRIKQYIIDGDAMQVVPSQRMTADYRAAPLDLYRALRCTNPSPYMYFLNLGDFHIAGSSPEILVRVEDGEVTLRPLAGTRKRGATEAEDLALEKELLADPKEIAEHVMLIDLGRNDVGRVSETGSVRVTDQMAIERYSHVMHIVSNVTGRLREEFSPLDVLRATFPAGTLSGAPKIRAMEIIDDVEPTRRGVYSGAIGYWSWSGNMDTAIAIRTAVIKDGLVHVQAGAGVVHDSVPASEWEETLNKARAIVRAVAMAERGLDDLG